MFDLAVTLTLTLTLNTQIWFDPASCSRDVGSRIFTYDLAVVTLTLTFDLQNLYLNCVINQNLVKFRKTVYKKIVLTGRMPRRTNSRNAHTEAITDGQPESIMPSVIPIGRGSIKIVCLVSY